jgi:hypothetical protein
MKSTRGWTALCAALGLVCAISSSAAAAEDPGPQIIGPLEVTSRSYPFGAAARQQVPMDLARRGYVEEEFILRGRARVFDWGPSFAPVASESGPYVTRVLVRRPKDSTRFNGTVIVEPLNPSADVDLPIMWAQSHEQLMADGYAWIGVTIKPVALLALKRFDPGRYAALGFPNVRRASACTAEKINPLSGPTTVADESGLAWDVLTQLGHTLKSPGGSGLLGKLSSARLYMTGQSQSAGYARTYATVFAPSAVTKEGRPLYDAYLYSGSPPWQVPLNQCAADLKEGDARLITPPVGVPVVELFAEGDIGTNISTRRPDSDAAPDLFRRYEIAGAAHVDPWEMRSFPSDSDSQRAQGRISAGADASCEPREVTPSDFPVRYLFNAAWRNLDQWVRKGVAAPRAARLQLQAARTPFLPERAFELDAVGNARGGVRSIAVDVPTARWVGAKRGAFRCMFYGYQFPLLPADLKRLYGSSAGYRNKVGARADELVSERWLTAEDRQQILHEAGRVTIP